MAINQLLTNLGYSFFSDSVAVFNQEFEQLFISARAIKASVKESSRIMEHPIENGTVISDHRIILPIEIELILILSSDDYQDVYKNIKQFYTSSTLLVVQTRSDIYQNQIIASMPHEEDPAQYDVLEISLNLRQIQFAQAEYGVKPLSPRNENNINRGALQSNPATPVQESAAFQALNLIRGA